MLCFSVVWWFILLILHFERIRVNYNDPPEAKTPLGTVQGRWETSYDGRPYASFEGIPYAKPPIADLRFQHENRTSCIKQRRECSLFLSISYGDKNNFSDLHMTYLKEPQPIEPWDGTWNATKLYTCIQNDLFLKHIVGDEDCLYLNVFVPNGVNTQQALDVVIHIHGGGFMIGAGHFILGPKYIMDRDIIFVSLNYRLGALGFLSTEDEVVPGNNGLKDQVLALKWIQQNIASFGGNPNSVTITGFSAGGASVHFHYLSPLSKGLFHRGMSMSGVAIDDWVIEENPLEYTKKLGSLIGCPTSNTRNLVDCLKTRPASLLIEKTRELYGFAPSPLCLLRPVVEKKSKNSFLIEHPYKSLVEKKVLDVPWITSVTRDDGFIISILHLNDLDQVSKKWIEAAPEILEYRTLRHRTEFANKIREYYFGTESEFNENNFDTFTKMCTDKFFVIHAETAAKLHSKATKSPVYFYYFNYDKGENSFLDYFHVGENIKGVSHGDDLTYFLGGPIAKKLSTSDTKLKNACLDMLYSYANTGVPKFEGVDWSSTGGEELTYLNITGPEDIKLQHTSDLSSSRKFWKDLGLLENENILVQKEEL